MTEKKPYKKVRSGSITATIWENEVNVEGKKELQKVYNVNIERSYKDKEDNWKTTNQFRQGDLPRLILVAQKAYEILSLSEKDSE